MFQNLFITRYSEDLENAILREKKIKAGSRQKKFDLINTIIKNGVTCTENYEIAALRSQ